MLMRWLFIAGIILAVTGAFLAPFSFHYSSAAQEKKTSKGYISSAENAEKPITQARFLQMVMAEYQAAENGLIVPSGAENHWASGIYATAKKEGLIDCSCQIKPDETITAKEAAKFVMLSINQKAGANLVTLEEVQSWTDRDKDDGLLDNHTAAALVQKMNEIFREKGLIGKGGKER